MESSSDVINDEREKRPFALAIHGTSSVRAQIIIEEGFDPEKSTDLAGRMKAFYYRFNLDTFPPEAYVESSWEKASLAADKDRLQGVESEPVLIVFEPPPVLTVLGKTIKRNPILNSSQEGSFNKKYKARILGVFSLPHLGLGQYSQPAQRVAVVNELQHKIISCG